MMSFQDTPTNIFRTSKETRFVLVYSLICFVRREIKAEIPAGNP